MRIAFIGLGEAAGAFISGWGCAMLEAIRTYDIKSDDPKAAGEIRSRAEGLGVRLCGTAKEALDGADLVFCTVTADQAVLAADGCAQFMADGAVWCDLNSCAPQSKLRANGIVRAQGGRYLDGAGLPQAQFGALFDFGARRRRIGADFARVADACPGDG